MVISSNDETMKNYSRNDSTILYNAILHDLSAIRAKQMLEALTIIFFVVYNFW